MLRLSRTLTRLPVCSSRVVTCRTLTTGVAQKVKKKAKKKSFILKRKNLYS